MLPSILRYLLGSEVAIRQFVGLDSKGASRMGYGCFGPESEQYSLRRLVSMERKADDWPEKVQLCLSLLAHQMLASDTVSLQECMITRCFASQR